MHMSHLLNVVASLCTCLYKHNIELLSFPLAFLVGHLQTEQNVTEGRTGAGGTTGKWKTYSKLMCMKYLANMFVHKRAT